MFSAESDKVVFRAPWFEKYQKEGVGIMSYTIEDYLRKEREEILKNLTEADIDRILEGMSVEERLAGLSLEERLTGLNSEERLRALRSIGLKPEEIKVIEDHLKRSKR